MNADNQLNQWDQWLDLLSPRAKAVLRSTVRPRQIEIPAWHLLLIPDEAEPEYLRFDSFQEMLEAIRGIEALESYAIFPFFGMQCHLNRAQGSSTLYYLRHPAGELHPLFDCQPGVVRVEDGHFGEAEMIVEDRPTGARPFRGGSDEGVAEEEVTLYEEAGAEPDPDQEEPGGDALEPGTAEPRNFP